HHDDGWGRYSKIKLADFGTEHVGQSVIDDLDDLLAGSNGFQNRLANGFLGNFLNEVAHNRKRNVGFQKRNPHFAHGCADIFFFQGAAATKLVKDAAEPVASFIEHSVFLSIKLQLYQRHKSAQNHSTQKTPVGETSLTDV